MVPLWLTLAPTRNVTDTNPAIALSFWKRQRAWRRKVAIYRLLQNVPLGPEEIRRLTDAYERTLSALSIKDRNDPLTEFIAKKILSLARPG